MVGPRSSAYLPQLAGAGPSFLPALVIAASKLARPFFQPSPASGTLQPPLPLQEFSPGLSPPPNPLQEFMPLQPCAATVAQVPWPAQSFLPLTPSPLHEFRPQHRCCSLAAAFSSAKRVRPASIDPATAPPKAARASLVKSRLFTSSIFISASRRRLIACQRFGWRMIHRLTT